MNTTPHNPTIREQASALVNNYARKSAALEAATADTRAQIAALTAALNKASAPYVEELENIELTAKAFALEYGEEIFGDKRSLTENGFCLAIRPSDVVQCEDEETVLVALMRDSLKGPTDADKIAASACVRLAPTLNKQYILSQYDAAPAWFAQYGISITERISASLKPAPKPRAKKATKLKTAEQPAQEQEAA